MIILLMVVTEKWEIFILVKEKSIKNQYNLKFFPNKFIYLNHY